MDWLYLLIIAFLAAGWLNSRMERKSFTEKVSQLETRVDLLHKAISAANAGVFYHHVNRSETIWDANSLAMFGLTGEERVILPGTWESILHPEDRAAALEQMIDVLNGKTNLFSHSYRILLPNNDVRWIEAVGYVIRNGLGLPAEISGFHFDITAQVKHEQSLRKSESQALKAMEAKTLFLANMSHEIRTPMNAIIGMIELLSTTSPTPTQKRYLHTLQNSSDVLLRIINDILDVSKIEAGKMTLEHKPFDVRTVVHECLAVFTQASDQKNLLLTGWIDPAIPKQIVGDSTRLQQVLMNLISNAFKFTAQGEIVVRVHLQAGKLCFSVDDTGIGIEQSKISGLFERFHQADVTTTRQFGGTGLGLTIVKEIINLWGGEAELHSEPGKGTSFRFGLPCDEVALSVERNGQEKVLLATRFGRLAELWHADPTAPEMVWVDNLQDFTAELERNAFTSVIVEQRFPGKRGSELLRQVRCKYPEIKTTLMGFERYIRSRQEQQMADHFFARPFLVNLLWDNDFLRITTENAKLSQIQRPDYGKLSVLCVDDNASNLMVLRGLFKRFNILADTASSGAKAIEMVKQRDYDLILMDYEMPEMDGPAATQRILRIKPCLVVGLSAHVGDYFEQQARRAGMSDFVRKPIKLDALHKILDDNFTATKNEQMRPG